MKNQFPGKSILYLGTRMLSVERVAEILAARELGYEIIMASDFPEVFAAYGFSHNFQVPLGKHDEAVKIILDYVNKHELSIDGVIGWQDQEEELTSRLTAVLGLPTCSLEANQYARNKMATRLLLEKVDNQYNPNYRLINHLSEFDEALEAIGVPCILKVSGLSGGRGILAIHQKDNAREIWEQFLEDNSPRKGGLYAQYREAILLEELLTGSEHSVSGIVADGEIYLLAITDKRIDISTQLQYENVLPSSLSLEIQEQAKDMAKKLIAASGINWRGFHIDFMVTEKGVRVLEFGARLGGECINSHLIPLASSGKINPYKLLLEYVIQGQKLPIAKDCTQSFERFAGSRVIAPSMPGRISRIQGLDKVCEHPNTRDFVQVKGIDSLMRPPTEAYEEYKVAYVVADSPFEKNLSQIFDDMLTDVEIDIVNP